MCIRDSLLAFLGMTLLILSACNKDDDNSTPVENPGNLSILFDNQLGNNSISVKDHGDSIYDYTDSNEQDYNISLYAYYISAIELEGPNGTKHIDPLNVSANADEVTGYYHVISTTPNSNVINLNGVEAGTYNKIRFTIGIDESGVQEGAAGGILDPANGCLLYTSPSPRDATLSRMPSSA